MSEYELTEGGVIRTVDRLFIPENPILQPWIEYLSFVDAGGVPDPEATPYIDPLVARISGGMVLTVSPRS